MNELFLDVTGEKAGDHITVDETAAFLGGLENQAYRDGKMRDAAYFETAGAAVHQFRRMGCILPEEIPNTAFNAMMLSGKYEQVHAVTIKRGKRFRPICNGEVSAEWTHCPWCGLRISSTQDTQAARGGDRRAISN